MVRFSYKIGNEEFRRKMPTCYADMTILELMEMERICEDEDSYISVLSSTPLEHIYLFPKDLRELLRDCLAFLESEVLFVKDFKGYEFEPLGKLQINQFEHFRVRPEVDNMVALFHSGEYSFSERMDKIDQIRELPADIAVYCRNFYNKEFADHLKKFAPLYEPYEPTEQEINAGYEDLQRWGIYSTYEQLAGGDIFKMHDVARLPVDDVYYFLMYKKVKLDYQNAILRTNKLS